MKKLMVEFGEAFSGAMIHGRHRAVRWVIVVVFWVLAVAAWVSGVALLIQGSQTGVVIIIDGFTFAILNCVWVYLFSADDDTAATGGGRQ